MATSGYSKITTIEVKNFMRFSHAIVAFDEGNIINIKGYNGRGKSSFEKAVGVCLMNAHKKKQTGFIKHGEDYFRVVVSFDDGIRILRDKYINGQSLYELYNGDNLLYTTKQGNRLSRIDDVPDTIRNYLGLIEVPIMETGYLNYQTRDDKLWLIQTSGSENYDSLNVILKTGEISRAVALINSDKNKLNSEIASLEGELQAAQLSLDSASIYSDELVIALTERESFAQDLCGMLDDIEAISDILSKLEQCKPIPELKKMGVSQYRDLLEIQESVLEIGKLTPIPKVEKVEIGKFKACKNMVSLISKEPEQVLSKEIPTINVQQLLELQGLVKTFTEYAGACKNTEAVEADFDKTKKELTDCVKEARKQGMKFVRCNNCGSYMKVNVGGANNA